MQNQYDPRTTSRIDPAISVGVPRAARDAGLRSYMLKVYNYMASGVLLTGIVAMLFANSAFGQQIMATPLRWLIILSPLAIVFAMSFGVNRMKTSTIQTLFWAFAVLMGMSMSTIFAGLHRRVDRADLLRGHRRASSASASTATPPRRICRASAPS